MKAIVCTKYGSPDYLKFMDRPKPVPKDDEVLVKVVATTVTAADTMMRKAEPFISRLFLGLTKPKNDITGTGFAGIVEAKGNAVTKFKVGDLVFGESGISFGANAEYVSVAEEGVIMKKPETLSFEEAATISDGVLTSFNFLKIIGKISEGQSVLVIGASGSLGTAAIQLAKYFGATVTGVCSGKNEKLVRSLGADYVIDYTKEEFTKSEIGFDIVYDAIGNSSFLKCRKILNENGVYLTPVLKFSQLMPMVIMSMLGNKKGKFSATGLLPASDLRIMLVNILEIINGNQLKTVIDKRYSLSDAIKAHHYVDTGRKTGNVVLEVL
ncbi:MAG: NAD(P)-dependent alcohol dehydrogenase [Bacteroidota bacterium]